MKNKTIVNFYKSLQEKNAPSILSESKNLITYLKKYSGSYKPNGMLSKILMIEWKSTDIPLRDKAIIQSAIGYILHLLKLVEKKNISLDINISNLKTCIADIKPTICRVDKNIDFDFLIGNTNIQESSIQFKIVEKLFYENSLPFSYNKYEFDHLVIPFLRTILESKIKGILGIDIIRDSKCNPIELSEILKILPTLKSIKLNNAYDSNLLSIIMKWLNHYMHRNLRPEVHTLHQVIQYVDPIFRAGKITHEFGILFSINSSAFAEDINKFHTEIESILNSKFPNCYILWKRKEVSTVGNKKK